DLVEVDELAIGAPGPRFRWSVDVFWKYRDGYRKRDVPRLLSRGNERTLSGVLPVRPRGRGPAVGQPVQREVVEHLVFGRRFVGIGVVGPLREAGMPEHPRRGEDR